MSSQDQKSPNKAEQLRMRRNQLSKQRMSDIHISRSSKRIIKPTGKNVSTPIVFSRVKTSSYNPVNKRNATHVKKRLSIPLKSPGAEINLPSIPVFPLGWRILSGSVSAVLLAAILFITTSPAFRVSGVHFAGLTRVNPNDAAMILNLKEIPVYSIYPDDIVAQLIENYPEMKEISIHVNFPSSVTINAQERQPIVAWEFGNQTFWIDDEGVVFPPRNNLSISQNSENYPDTLEKSELTITDEASFIPENILTIRSDTLPPQPPLPAYPEKFIKTTDKFISEFVVQDQIQNMPKYVDMNIINTAQTLSNYVLPGTKIVYSTSDGLGWSDSRGWNVYVGTKLENIELKLIEYQAIIDQLERIAMKPVMISVEHIHAPFYRLE